jgi:hypothetical protein
MCEQYRSQQRRLDMDLEDRYTRIFVVEDKMPKVRHPHHFYDDKDCGDYTIKVFDACYAYGYGDGNEGGNGYGKGNDKGTGYGNSWGKGDGSVDGNGRGNGDGDKYGDGSGVGISPP